MHASNNGYFINVILFWAILAVLGRCGILPNCVAICRLVCDLQVFVGQWQVASNCNGIWFNCISTLKVKFCTSRKMWKCHDLLLVCPTKPNSMVQFVGRQNLDHFKASLVLLGNTIHNWSPWCTYRSLFVCSVCYQSHWRHPPHTQFEHYGHYWEWLKEWWQEF